MEFTPIRKLMKANLPIQNTWPNLSQSPSSSPCFLWTSLGILNVFQPKRSPQELWKVNKFQRTCKRFNNIHTQVVTSALSLYFKDRNQTYYVVPTHQVTHGKKRTWFRVLCHTQTTNSYHFMSGQMFSYSSWWLNHPLEKKHWSNWIIFSRFRCQNQKIYETTSQYCTKLSMSADFSAATI